MRGDPAVGQEQSQVHVGLGQRDPQFADIREPPDLVADSGNAPGGSGGRRGIDADWIDDRAPRADNRVIGFEGVDRRTGAPRASQGRRRVTSRRPTSWIRSAAEVRGAPIFGICLGHQLLGQAFGAHPFERKSGHRSANQPVRNEGTSKLEITTPDRGLAVDPATLSPDVEPVHAT